MKRTKEELLKMFGDIVGERNDEMVISFMEDISDTVVEHPEPTPETDEYRDKYEELLKRYKARFYGESEGDTPRPREEVDEREVKYEDIFKED